jgi:hypothetical protein
MGSFICDCRKGYEGDGMTNGTGCRPIATQYRRMPRIAIELGKYLRIEFETFRSVIMIMIMVFFFFFFLRGLCLCLFA